MQIVDEFVETKAALLDGGAGIGNADAITRLDERFGVRYAATFWATYLDEPLEIVSWKVEAAGEEAAPACGSIAGGAPTARRALWRYPHTAGSNGRPRHGRSLPLPSIRFLTCHGIIEPPHRYAPAGSRLDRTG